eukprot:2419721-Rhodomonas_salina.2
MMSVPDIAFQTRRTIASEAMSVRDIAYQTRSTIGGAYLLFLRPFRDKCAEPMVAAWLCQYRTSRSRSAAAHGYGSHVSTGHAIPHAYVSTAFCIAHAQAATGRLPTEIAVQYYPTRLVAAYPMSVPDIA